jgi:hypothetical protein
MCCWCCDASLVLGLGHLKLSSFRWLLVHLGIPRARLGFGLGLKKPKLKFLGLSLALLDLWAYK